MGVGVEGLEGRQAVNASDFSIPEFQGLQRLLLVHGAWNYRRMGKTVRFFLLKNMVFPLSIFFFNFWCGYAGTNPYTGWDITLCVLVSSACLSLPAAAFFFFFFCRPVVLQRCVRVCGAKGTFCVAVDGCCCCCWRWRWSWWW